MASTVEHGLIGGILAGMVFAMTEMICGALEKGSFFPFCVSLPLQQPPPQIPLGTATVVGLITHMVVSMMFGLIAAVIISKVASVVSSQPGIVIVASVVGLILWPLDFHVIAPPSKRALVRHAGRLVLAGTHRAHDLFWSGPGSVPGEPALQRRSV